MTDKPVPSVLITTTGDDTLAAFEAVCGLYRLFPGGAPTAPGCPGGVAVSGIAVQIGLCHMVGDEG